MSKSDEIILALWSEYKEQIGRAIPTFFTFTNDLVEEILFKADIPFETGKDTINIEVSKLIDIDGNQVHLRYEALSTRGIGYSAAILFVCQQVLAVEEMVANNVHSENAYFPHLRDSLSKDLEPLSQNPFSYDEFEAIWSTLYREIYRISGTQKCITFSFERSTGVFKAKRFPLSQALFSLEDLLRLSDKIGFSEVKRIGEHYLFDRIVINRQILSSRGRKLTTYIWMREALSRQLKNFAQSTEEINRVRVSLEKRTVSIDELSIKLYKDSIDWFSTEYVIYLFDKGNNLISDVIAVNDYFRAKIFHRSYSILVPSREGDSWTLSKEHYYPSIGDELFIILKKENDYGIQNFIFSRLAIEGDQCSTEEVKGAKQITAIKMKIGQAFLGDCSIVNGQISLAKKSNREHDYRFKGGTLVNLKQDRFSAYSLPTHLCTVDREISLSGRVKINDALYDFDKFREEVKTITRDREYKLELSSDLKCKIKIAPITRKTNKHVAYKTDKGKVLPITQLLKRDTYSHAKKPKSSHELYIQLSSLMSENSVEEVLDLIEDHQSSGDYEYVNKIK